MIARASRALGRAAWALVLVGASLGAQAGTPAAARSAPESAATQSMERIGEAIYLRGMLGSGAPLRAVREGGVQGSQGAEAACVNCHRRSGLGSTHQGNGLRTGAPTSQIPPVAGRYLFERAAGPGGANLPYVDGMRGNRSPYTPATLARAIREGIDSDGRKLGNLMPHFEIGDADLSALVAYLKTLYPAKVAGVTADALRFATIITPEVEPERRKAMLEVMEKFVAERNSRQMVPSAPMHASAHAQYSRSMFMVHRQWELQVWDLTGPPATWGGQLERYYAREPVLAVISGLGRSWAPVHAFCEHQRLACLFPNVEVPVDAPGDFYELYLSRGVLLEAGLIATGLAEQRPGAPIRVVHQVYRAGDSGEAGAKALGQALREQGIDVRDTALAPSDPDPSAGVRAARGADALVLWLRPADLAALGDAGAAPPIVYMSGQLGGLENTPLPDAWRARTRMAYPYDLPDRRIVRVDYPLGWFRIRGIKVVDEQMQADTYLACGLVSEALNEMVDAFYGPYLVEMLQSMVEHRIVTGYYPRLSLAENQHFASKGGYLVRFAEGGGGKLVADHEWITP